MDASEVTRLAALYDLHGNLPALESTLAEIGAMGIDTILCGGDVALGPMPVETLHRLRELGPRVHWIRGNCDRLMVEAFDGRLPDRLPAPIRDTIVWAGGQLDRSDRDFLAALPQTLALEVRGIGDVLFCHATPRSDEEIMTVMTAPDRVRSMLEGTSQKIVVCGHTHMQFDRVVDDVRLINAGSVGMPYGRPGAYWLLLDSGVVSRRTEYDLERAAAHVRRTAYPQADDFAERSVLHPISEQEALGMFERPRR